MINYYIIPVSNGDTFKCVKSLKQNQGNDTQFTYLINNDLSQVLRVPFMQKYNGLAVILTTKTLIKKSFNPQELLKEEKYVYDPDFNLFIINCDSDYFKNNFNPSKLVSMDLRNYMNIFNNSDADLKVYFDIVSKKQNHVFIGENDKPVKLVFNGSIWELSK